VIGDVNQLLRGGLAVSSFVSGLFFLRFWRLSRERLFLCFALAFVALGCNWIVLGLTHPDPETRHYAYLIRLLAFVLILVGIWEKNRQRAR
jgi:peptidoglycan/LPS O-acetylase OafA/YrhL